MLQAWEVGEGLGAQAGEAGSSKSFVTAALRGCTKPFRDRSIWSLRRGPRCRENARPDILLCCFDALNLRLSGAHLQGARVDWSEFWASRNLKNAEKSSKLNAA